MPVRGGYLMQYTAGYIVVKALSGEVVVDRAIDAVLAGTSGLAYHLALGTRSSGGEGDPDTQKQLYTITHIPTGCALGSLPIQGEAFAREALEKVASLSEQYPESIEWRQARPFASEEIARLAGQLIHWIMADVYARSKLATRLQHARATPPKKGMRRTRAANPPQSSEGH
jgi:hypothetical protein